MAMSNMTKRSQLPEFDLNWLHGRVKEDDDGCLIWAGHITAGGQPQASLNHKTFLVRRAVWTLVHEFEPSKKLWMTVRCKKHGCVHPDCVVTHTRSDAMKGLSKPLAVRARMSATKRKQSRISEESVAAMRVETGTLAEIAERHNVDLSYVSKLRLGQVRREYSNPFAGLALMGGSRG